MSSTPITAAYRCLTCDLAIILIEYYGVQTQTRRHSFILSLLGIRHIVVAVDRDGFDGL